MLFRTGNNEERTFSLYFESDQWTVYEIASILQIFQTITITTTTEDVNLRIKATNKTTV